MANRPMENPERQMPVHVEAAYKAAVDNIIFLKRQQWVATSFTGSGGYRAEMAPGDRLPTPLVQPVTSSVGRLESDIDGMRQGHLGNLAREIAASILMPSFAAM